MAAPSDPNRPTLFLKKDKNKEKAPAVQQRQASFAAARAVRVGQRGARPLESVDPRVRGLTYADYQALKEFHDLTEQINLRDEVLAREGIRSINVPPEGAPKRGRGALTELLLQSFASLPGDIVAPPTEAELAAIKDVATHNLENHFQYSQGGFGRPDALRAADERAASYFTRNAEEAQRQRRERDRGPREVRESIFRDALVERK